jgi:hypothetical protein
LSDTLISTTTALDYSLLTLNGLLTFTGGRGLSTINLAFCSPLLYSLFTSCIVYKPLCFNLDYKPILLSFSLNSTPLLRETKRTRVWKKQDKELIARLALDLPSVPICTTTEALDSYLVSLHESLELIASRAVPLSSLSSTPVKAQ